LLSQAVEKNDMRQLGKKASLMGEQITTVLTLTVLTGLSSIKISSKWLTVSCRKIQHKITIKETQQITLKSFHYYVTPRFKPVNILRLHKNKAWQHILEN